MNVALCSTVFPSILRFFRPFYESVQRQEDASFTVHLALDGVSPEELAAACGAEVDAEYSVAEPGWSPAQVRQQAWEQLCPRFDAVVLVDADDVLHPDRVRTAVHALDQADVYGCALELVDEAGADINLKFERPHADPDTDWSQSLALYNVFGLSNTAYRTRVLAAALPLPADVVAVDWYLVTRACWAGATLVFDDVPQMDYRQHGDNLGRVVPPFDAHYLAQATGAAQRHHARLASALWGSPPLASAPSASARLASAPSVSAPSASARSHGSARSAEWFARERAATVDAFATAMQQDATRDAYLEAINRPAKKVFAWWEFVAMPELETIWNP